ncbi:MAG TPA: hypothetical protein VFW96_26775 [Thermomicrobiales bacterium]|nr:hypothetical protein [Thermomicrobiales bacterium]
MQQRVAERARDKHVGVEGDRRRRAWAEARVSAAAMADGYEAVHRRLVAAAGRA